MVVGNSGECMYLVTRDELRLCVLAYLSTLAALETKVRSLSSLGRIVYFCEVLEQR